MNVLEASEAKVKHEAYVDARISKRIDKLASSLHLLHRCFTLASQIV